MGFLDDAKDKLGDAVDDHGDKIGTGSTRRPTSADDKTGGKFDDKIDTGADKPRTASTRSTARTTTSP